MPKSVRLAAVLVSVLALLGSAPVLAFDWEPFVFPDGDQHYVVEIFQGQDAAAPAMTLDVAIADTGDTFDVTTALTFDRRNVAPDDLQNAFFGGGFGLGPALMFGPTFLILPMLLDGQDIAVGEPVELPGLGVLHMDGEVEVAGHRCVEIRLEPQAQTAVAMEFALAEDLPVPCYSRYGEGEDAVEVRLVRAD